MHSFFSFDRLDSTDRTNEHIVYKSLIYNIFLFFSFCGACIVLERTFGIRGLLLLLPHRWSCRGSCARARGAAARTRIRAVRRPTGMAEDMA